MAILLGFTFAGSSLMGSSSRFQVSDRRSGEKDPTLPFPLPIKKATRRMNSRQDVGRFVLMPTGALGGDHLELTFTWRFTEEAFRSGIFFK